MVRFLRQCAIGAMILAFSVLPAFVMPATSRADECGPGWAWSVELNECVFVAPAANGPGGSDGERISVRISGAGIGRARGSARVRSAAKRPAWGWGLVISTQTCCGRPGPIADCPVMGAMLPAGGSRPQAGP